MKRTYFLIYLLEGRQTIILNRGHKTAEDALLDGIASFPLTGNYRMRRTGDVLCHEDGAPYPDVEIAQIGVFPVALLPADFPGILPSPSRQAA